jgi:hypothetical protein
MENFHYPLSISSGEEYPSRKSLINLTWCLIHPRESRPRRIKAKLNGINKLSGDAIFNTLLGFVGVINSKSPCNYLSLGGFERI